MKSYNAEEITNRLRTLRKAHNLSQDKLSDILGYDRKYIGRVEFGERGYSIDLLIALSEYFDVTLDYLILGKEKSTPKAADLDDVILKLTKIRDSL
jgi:transcriptional regulator with XRE-family HTH domain